MASQIDTSGVHPYQRTEGDRIVCEVCPRECTLADGQRGLCFVRQRSGEHIELTTYGRSSGFAIDPIEKKPLNHFYPGTSVLSFGTAGCNLTCKFCQNWDISKSREFDQLQSQATPARIAEMCAEQGCKSVAFTYNDPVIFIEYAIDTAIACRQRGIKTVAVTAGYVSPKPRRAFFQHLDAANIDLKAFNADFYRELTSSSLSVVLDTLLYVRHETDTWLEITTLLIPGKNDSDQELNDMSAWIVKNLGPDVPLHFSAFHPDYKMIDVPKTPKETLTRARKIAMSHGLRYVYTGNVHDRAGDCTSCAACGEFLIQRDWYDIVDFKLKDGACPKCSTPLPGRFDAKPGTWGRRRLRTIP